MTIVYKDDGQGGKVCSISSEITYLNCCIKSIKYIKILEIQCSLLRKCINYMLLHAFDTEDEDIENAVI